MLIEIEQQQERAAIIDIVGVGISERNFGRGEITVDINSVDISVDCPFREAGDAFL